MKTTVEKKFLPYGRQTISEDDIASVVEVLRSDWLTQGPQIERFESKLASYLGCKHVVSCTSGTSALHLAMLALELGEGDAIVTSANTFLASANCAHYVGANVFFADIDPSTGIISLESLDQILEADGGEKIRNIIPVHFAGQPCDMAAIKSLAEKYGVTVVDDACHALGAKISIDNQTLTIGGSGFSDMTVFSFHPVKHVAAGEGGAVATNDDVLAEKLKLFRNHGTRKESFELPDLAYAPTGEINPWYYEMQHLGYNYRLTDIQATLACSQLDRINTSVERRREIAALYEKLIDEAFVPDQVTYLKCRENVGHAYHLFVLQVDFTAFNADRASVMNRLKEKGIGTQVHYIPVPYQPYHRKRLLQPDRFAGAAAYYERALSIPMYPVLTDDDCHRVIEMLKSVLYGGS